MNKTEYMNKLDNEIAILKEKLSKCEENDYVKQAIILGRINGLLTAKLIAWDLGE